MANYDEAHVICAACGVKFCMPADLEQQHRRKHDTFYCPNGHGQHFPGKTAEEKKIEQLTYELKQRARDEARRFSELYTRVGQLEQLACMCPLCGDKTGQRNWRDETNAAKLQEHLRDEHGARQRLRALMPGISETG